MNRKTQEYLPRAAKGWVRWDMKGVADERGGAGGSSGGAGTARFWRYSRDALQISGGRTCFPPLMRLVSPSPKLFSEKKVK